MLSYVKCFKYGSHSGLAAGQSRRETNLGYFCSIGKERRRKKRDLSQFDERPTAAHDKTVNLHPHPHGPMLLCYLLKIKMVYIANVNGYSQWLDSVINRNCAADL